MFGNLFGKKDAAPESKDAVWLSDTARRNGLRGDVEILAEDSCVIVVALTLAAAEEVAGALSTFNPVRCLSVVDAGALRERLATRGAVVVAMPGALQAQGAPEPAVPLEVLVCGRNERRSADDGIVRAAAALAAASHVTFHLSLDDALLRVHGDKLKPLLEKIGMNESESIEHEFVSRAIRNAQKD